MYAVVGCGECGMLWVVEGRPETTGCPRCGTRRPYARRRKFHTTEDEDHAREVRASMLAARQDHGDTFAGLDSFAEMESRIDEVGPDDAEYLDAAGVDPDAVAAAGERVASGGESKSRKTVVREAVRECEEATEDAVVAYAEQRGVDPEYTRRALEKLVRAGEATENGGTYRLV